MVHWQKGHSALTYLVGLVINKIIADMSSFTENRSRLAFLHFTRVFTSRLQKDSTTCFRGKKKRISTSIQIISSFFNEI